MTAPLIAIAGRPNVGKSTLFNRLVGGRPALVHNSPHLTRDRRYGELDYDGRKLRVVDTGGLDPDAAKEVLGAGVHRQARAALGEADAVILVIDARAGVSPLDLEVASMLRKLPIPTYLAANKVDGPKQEPLLGELYSIGLGEVYGISASHGRGVEQLMDAVVEGLPEASDEDNEDEDGEWKWPTEGELANPERPIRVAFLGKPNAGKSSMLNRLVGSERSLVHDQPGTTTDPVDSEFELDGQEFILVDTAGIRRRAKVQAEQEKISVSLALGQIRRADVVVLVLDGALGPSDQDARLAAMIVEAGRGLVIALNKADLLTGGTVVRELREKSAEDFRFVSYAPMIMMSALYGDGITDVMEAVVRVSGQHRKRVTTSELNKFFADVCETHPPPIHHGRAVTVRYLTQGGVCPPTFLLWANRKKGLSESYRRFVVNQLRARYGFEGSPMRLVIKAKNEKRPGGKRGRKRR